MEYDEAAKDGQFRIGTSAGNTGNGTQRPSSFHGQGSPDRDDHKQDILQFFHQVDRSLHPFPKNKRSPRSREATQPSGNRAC